MNKIPYPFRFLFLVAVNAISVAVFIKAFIWFFEVPVDISDLTITFILATALLSMISATIWAEKKRLVFLKKVFTFIYITSIIP